MVSALSVSVDEHTLAASSVEMLASPFHADVLDPVTSRGPSSVNHVRVARAKGPLLLLARLCDPQQFVRPFRSLTRIALCPSLISQQNVLLMQFEQAVLRVGGILT